MKFYNKKSYIETFKHIFNQIPYGKKDWKLYHVMTEEMNVSRYDMSYFVKAFDTIDRTFHEQFISIPDELKKFYSDFFSQKVQKIYDKFTNDIKDESFKSFSDNLLRCFIKYNITKNFNNK